MSFKHLIIISCIPIHVFNMKFCVASEPFDATQSAQPTLSGREVNQLIQNFVNFKLQLQKSKINALPQESPLIERQTYKCPLQGCSNTYSRKDNAKRHFLDKHVNLSKDVHRTPKRLQFISHEKGSYRCKQCMQSYSTRNDLIKHGMTIHLNNDTHQ